AVDRHTYLSGEFGASMASIGDSSPRIHYYNQGLTDDYPVNNNHVSRAILGAKGGYEFMNPQQTLALHLGLGFYAAPTDNTFDGHLVETATGDPSATLYQYSFDMNTMRLM